MKTKGLQFAVRILGLVQLALGILFWNADNSPLVILHILLGTLLTIALLVLVIRGFRKGLSKPLMALALLWTIGLPLYGLIQDDLLVGSFHWVAQVLHLLCGLGAVAIGELISARLINKEK